MTAVAIELAKLIKEARQRARYRRILIATVALGAALVAAVAYTQLSESSAAVLPACQTGDYRVSVRGVEPSTQSMIGAVSISGLSSSPCRFDKTVEVSVVGRSGVPLVSPAHWSVTGKLKRAHRLLTYWAWGEWCGDRGGTFTVRVAGAPVSSWITASPGGRCDGMAPPKLTRLRQ